LDEGQSSDIAADVASRGAGSDGAGLAAIAGFVIFAASLATLAEMHLRDGSLASGMVDLHVYRAGGLVALRSGNLYGARLVRNLFFTYPPMAALVFSAISAIPMN
jgi:hypothetical protein